MPRPPQKKTAPQPGETVYDPCCGTGGFLAEAYQHLARRLGDAAPATAIERLKHDTFFGREKENLVFPIALANLVLHGIDQPNLWHGNTLTGTPTYAGLFGGAPRRFDLILTNPPFGGKEGTDAQSRFAFRTGATQVLFLQQVMDDLAEGGRCGIVLDDAALPATLLQLLTVRGDDPVQEQGPFPSFARLLPFRGTPEGDSALSWTLDIEARRARARDEMAPHLAEAERQRAQAIHWRTRAAALRRDKTQAAALEEVLAQLAVREREAREAQARADAIDVAVFDLKAVNPNARGGQDNRSPEAVLAAIAEHQRTIDAALSRLNRLLKEPDSSHDHESLEQPDRGAETPGRSTFKEQFNR